MKSKYFDLQQISEGIYAAVVVKGSGAMGNAGIVDLGDQTLVFDTFYSPQAAADLRKAAEQLFARPVRLVINSHWHMDHIIGNQLFPEADIIATEKTRQLISSRAARFLEYAKAHPEYPAMLERQLQAEPDEAKRRELSENLGDIKELDAALSHIRLKLPHITFEQSLALYGTKRTAILLSFGGGHTESDAFLYLPDDRVAFLGDLLSVDNHPNIKDGSAQEWLQILEQIKTLAIETAVPGHGPVGGYTHLITLENYFNELIQLAADLEKTGVSLEEALQAPMPAAYADWSAAGLFSRNLGILLEQNSVAKPR